MKILHTADWHLNNETADEMDDILNFIFNMADERNVDLTVIAGDIFDRRDIRFDSKAVRSAFAHITGLAEISPVLINIGTPSHDGMCSELFRFAKTDNPVYVASRPEQLVFNGETFSPIEYLASYPEVFRGSDLCAVLSVLPQPTKQWFQGDCSIDEADQQIATGMGTILGGFGAMAHGCGIPHILVFHHTIHGAKVGDNQYMIGREIEVPRDLMDLAKADIGMGGHIHYAQEIKGENCSYFYAGGPQRLNYGEMEPKGFYIHTIDGKVESEWIETPARKLFKADADLTNGLKLSEVLTAMESGNLLPDSILGSFVRLELKTWQDEAHHIDRDKIKAYLVNNGAKGADVRIIRIPRENVRSQQILKVYTLREKIEERAATVGDDIPEGVPELADRLETDEPDAIIEGVAAG